jgi:hypothetical protein
VGEKVMLVLKGMRSQVIQQSVSVVERVEREVFIQEGDEIVCEVVGKAHRIGTTPEIEIRDPQFVRVVEVRKQPH